MQISYSKISTFVNCPYKYKLTYIDKLKTFADDSYNNALYLGQAMHICLQESIEAGIKNFYSNYPVIDDNIVSEAYKLELIAKKARKLIPPSGECEVKLTDTETGYTGYIDYLNIYNNDLPCALYDFKYCSSAGVQRYLDSAQLHLYKYFYEKQGLGKIGSLHYLIIPKTNIRLKKEETLGEFRARITQECEKIEPYIIDVEYNPNKVIEFLTDTKRTIECTDFVKNESRLCNYCEFQQYCKLGDMTMLLPANQRRELNDVKHHKIWIYGAPFSGKTTFANQFADPLMLNTDGNIGEVDAPYILIKDNVVVDGRMLKRTLGWQIFKDTISELEKKQNDFKSIIVDLLEDTYEMCRVYMYDKLGINHESDAGFGKGYDMIRNEFLNTMKRLMTLDYENIILISHEDASRDLTRKTGDKLSVIKPNINDKIANKIAGMVDIVARVVADGDTHTLSFKTNESVFGGGRIKVAVSELPLTYEDFLSIYPVHQHKTEAVTNPDTVPVVETVETAPVVEEVPAVEAVPVTRQQVTTTTRRRASRPVQPQPAVETVETEEELPF